MPDKDYYMGTKGVELVESDVPEEAVWVCDECYERSGVRCSERGVRPLECHFQPPVPNWRKEG